MISSYLKSALNQFADLNLKGGFSALADAGSDFLGIFMLGLTFWSLNGLLRNKNLKPREKILPFIGHGLYFLTRGALAIAVLAGAASLIPLFIGISSIVGTYRNFMSYYKERKEQINLNKELMSKEQLLNYVSTIKNPADIKCVTDYVSKPDQIFQSLYDLRKRIMTDPSIDYLTKFDIITILNEAIVKVSEGENVTIALQKQLTGKHTWIIDNIENINQEIESYQSAAEQYKNLQLRTSLKDRIAYYKQTHTKIYAQDLPASIKSDLIKLLNGGKLSENTLHQFYASLGNHYLNITSYTQLQNTDIQFSTLLKIEHEPYAELIQKFILSPREIYSVTSKLFLSLEQAGISISEITIARDRFMNDPSNPNHANNLMQLLNELLQGNKTNERTNIISNTAKIQIAENIAKINVHLQLAAAFDQLTIKPDDKLRIKTFQTASLNQYANVSHQHTEFPSPAIKFDLNKGDILMEFGIAPAVDSVSKEFSKSVKHLNEKHDKIKKDIAKQLLGINWFHKRVKTKAFKKTKHTQQQYFSSDFDHRFETTFNLLLKKQRLNFLKYSTPRRLVNAGISTVVAGISLLATAAIVSPVTPALPILTTIGMVFSGGVMANSFYLYKKQEKGASKINKVAKDAKSAAGPDFETFDQNKKHLQKLRDEVQKKAELQAKEKQQGTKRRWYMPMRSRQPVEAIHRSENPEILNDQKSDALKSNKNK